MSCEFEIRLMVLIGHCVVAMCGVGHCNRVQGLCVHFQYLPDIMLLLTELEVHMRKYLFCGWVERSEAHAP